MFTSSRDYTLGRIYPLRFSTHAWGEGVNFTTNLPHSGECAEHFGAILKKFPPQVSTRSTAAAWGCHVHNEVNKSLKKEIFDCSNIGDFYDCGCAETEEEKRVRLEKEGKGGKVV